MYCVQTLKLSRTKELIFTATFVALAVFTPLVFHFFGGMNAGRTFLPMHFFVLAAGLLLGWRAGLITGLAAPLISFLFSGMPVINVLPFIIVELSAYGLIAGLLRQKFNVWISLLGALALGRLAVLSAVFLFSNMNAVNFVLSAARDGWKGIIIQILFIPVVIRELRKYFN